MRQKLFPVLLLALLACACNKEVDTTPELPFAVFPNPCRGQVNVFFPFNPSSPTVECSLLDRDGKVLINVPNLPAGGPLAFALEEEGIYYIEAKLDGATFKEEILNLE
ncbi:MAG: T9SS type A sorting domain-containing protein [Lewinellaceae bacterium]|nr:T9SS type A sorting domain-containing protein [Lewinellaceae bacterium]